MMTIGEVTVDGKDIEVGPSNEMCFLGSADYQGRTARRKCEEVLLWEKPQWED